MNYTIYHLMSTTDESTQAIIDKMRTPYRELDRTIVDFYCLSASHILEVEDEFTSTSPTNYLKEKSAYVEQLVELGSYSPVANVEAKDHIEAFVKTNNINKHWYLYRDKGLEVIGSPTRTTASDDLIAWDGNYYLIGALGFLDIKNAKFVEYAE